MYDLSIIIPVYNTKKELLDKCLLSIKNQELTNYEVIIVDDGSNEETKKILDDINDPTIKIFHKENKGVSSSRNLGIKESNSKYITFLDSDDYIDKCYNELIKLMDDNRLDIISYAISIDNEVSHLEDKCIIGEKDNITLNKSDYLKEVIDINNFNCVIWNKIYKSSIIKENNILFDEDIHVAEDTIFAVKYALKINKAMHINKPYYHYIIHNNSALRVKDESFIKRVETSITAYDRVMNLLKYDEKLFGYAVIQASHAKLGLSEHYYNFKYNNYKKLIKDNKEWIKNHKKYIKEYASKREKLRINLFLFNTKLDCYILNRRNKKRSN